ncbi:HAMP domain-containing sensor histidine kinase [Nannocystis bainbridge]|uniref:histidine kinase n=1 Tax=Nannocystis bainbridge TaxID=2995303 RepID=A0ABT5DRD9_9BACT|nr:ATP-binding protein [Nannocystis bainbridge]MDC0716216.1 ATP-binding protein [Nannocystis bainbridge]
MWIGASTALSLVVFAGTAGLIVYLDEEEEGQAGGFVEEDSLAEAFEQVGLALAAAAPLGLLLAVFGAHWHARRAVKRVDTVVRAAARMSAEHLGERLPVSSTGDELDALSEALNGLFTRLERGTALQRQFAADASHELRSPLAVLSSTLEVALRRPRTREEWEVAANRALREVRHMSRLVESLLILARAGIIIRREPASVASLAHAVAERWLPAARAAGVAIQVCRVGLDELTVERGLMEGALGNIVANAIAHTPRGSTVCLESRVTTAAIDIVVSDEGPGVPAHERERIFQPFVRGASPVADRVDARAGLGLGLAIVRRVIEGHGGEIHVERAARGGAAFVVRLPRTGSRGWPDGAAITEAVESRRSADTGPARRTG